MRKAIYSSLALFSALLLTGANASATSYGDNITIYDAKSSSTTGWYGQQEDDEVEPNMIKSQVWDLEGFYLDGSMLSAVGGFDFINGVANYPLYTSGDLFLDITGDATYGTTGTSLRNGYDIVLDLDFANKNFTAYQIKDSTTLLDVESYNQPGSSPWKYVSGGVFLTTGNITYTSFADFDNTSLNLSGASHNAFTVNIGFLDPGTDFISHFTMGCGNDNLMGEGSTPVPEPATMMLLGTGLAGLAGAHRRKRTNA